MVDKGFIIREELSNLNLVLNILLMVLFIFQMLVLDILFIEKIVKYCVYIERFIVKVKIYKMFFVCIFILLFKNINKIWFVCCYLILFYDVFVIDSKNCSK